MLDRDKHQTGKFTLNIIYQFLEYNHTDFLWYPLRACADYLLDEGQDSSPSNRLNADSLLQYKMKKELLTNAFMNEKGNSHGTNEAYNWLEEQQMESSDLLNKLEAVMHRLDAS